MAYNPNLPAGTYRARALQADCFPTNNGEGLMLGVEWVVTQGEYEGSQLLGNICLIDGSGNLTKNYADTREWAKSWDGIDTAYFKGHFSEWEVDIVVARKLISVADEQGNVTQREVPEVKYVNDPNGRHSKAVKAGDHRALGAKFGAKLRAAAAANPAPKNAPATKPTAARPANVPPPADPPVSVNANGISAQQLMCEAWEAFKANNAELDEAKRNQKWFQIVGNHVPAGENPRTQPAEVWKAILADVQDDIPF